MRDPDDNRASDLEICDVEALSSRAELSAATLVLMTTIEIEGPSLGTMLVEVG